MNAVAPPPALIGRIVPLARAQAGPVLAMGAWLKNSLCLVAGDRACLSRDIGDLATAEACRAHERTARELLDWLGEKPACIAHDLHPDFHSSRFAAQLAAELDVPLVEVQHHHAHIAAVCAEHGVEHSVIGLALDGVGLGDDGTAWGGELLHVTGAAYERVGHLRPLPLPGGDRAATEPWRMAAAVLHELGRNDEIARRYAHEPAAATVATMLQRGFNCPHTSSMGRVFDAAAGLLGLCQKMEFEAQAAVAVEQAATRYIASHGMPQVDADDWHIDTAGQLDLLPLLAQLAGMDDAAHGAAIFHATLVAALGAWALQAAQRSGTTTLVCGGGCFCNRLLTEGLRQYFADAGVSLLLPQDMSPGDAAIALGQAWVASRRQGV